MKRVLVYFAAILTVCACANSTVSNKHKEKEEARARLEREQFVRDSLKRDQEIKDSLALVERNAEIIARVSNNFIHEKDEFSNTTWVKPKSAPKYTNRNGVYCYFATEEGKAHLNFRFKYQYYASEWLFIKNMIFNIDDENITIVPDMERDSGNGGMIWEWCDVSVNSNDARINEEFIKKIANAKSVKVKMNGSQYYDTRTLTAEQIKSIKEAYEYYIALGGEFIE